MEHAFNIPILFVVFNRPETEQVVFDEIKKLKPKHLFVVADGAREGKAGEKERCEAAKKIIDQVDWDCEVQKNYSEVNMGCGKRLSSGITWFFDNVEEGIILEDDCVPDQSFFYYAESLLEKYRDDERVMMISGNNFQGGIKRGDGDYYFSRIPHIWGWASWRRAWKKYDFDVKDFPDFLKDRTIEKIWDKKNVQKYWLERIEDVYKHRLDTWDYQFVYTVWKNDGICIVPNVNLVSNVGFGAGASNTFNSSDPLANIPARPISSPLTHPREVIVNKKADDLENSAIYIKHYRIKHFLKQLGLFNYVRNIYHKL